MSANINKKRICVVGAGRWGINHIKTLKKIGALSGVVELNDQARNKIKDEFPDILLFNNLDESFKYNFSAYTIATPAPTHFNIAKKIIENKYPVLIEKPITLKSKEAEDIVKLSKKYNVNVMVGHILLFHPAIIKIKELIDNGKIGDLQYIYSNRLNLGQVRTEENVFWSFAPHDISILQYFINKFPIKINTSGGAFVQPNIYDTTLTMLEYPDNIKAHIYLSWLHPFKEHRIVVIGSKGMISFEDSLKNKPLIYYDKQYELIDNLPKKKDGLVEQINYNMKLPPLEEELNYFINNLDNEIEISNAENGLEVVKILEEATNSLNY